MYLAGARTIAGDNGEVSSGGTLLDGLVRQSGIGSILLYFFIFGIVMLVISLIIGFVRAHLVAKDTGVTLKKMYGKGLQSLLMMFLMPAVVLIGIMLVGALFQGIVGIMGEVLNINTGGGSTSVAQEIFKFCLPKGWESDAGANVSLISFELKYSDLKSYNIDMNAYNVLLSVLLSLIMIFVLGLASIGLVERLINVLLLYMIAPIPMACAPLDEGNRANIWKDLMISKLLSAGGIIMSMYIYYLVINYAGQVFDASKITDTNLKSVYNVVYLIVIVGGAFCACKGGQVIASLIGHNTGDSGAAQDAQSFVRLMMGGAHLLTHGLGAVIKGGVIGGKAVAHTVSHMKQRKAARAAASGGSGGGSSGGGDSGGSGGGGYGGGESPFEGITPNRLQSTSTGGVDIGQRPAPSGSARTSSAPSPSPLLTSPPSNMTPAEIKQKYIQADAQRMAGRNSSATRKQPSAPASAAKMDLGAFTAKTRDRILNSVPPLPRPAQPSRFTELNKTAGDEEEQEDGNKKG